MEEPRLFWPTFFGREYGFIKLSSEYINHVYEKIFYMKTYMGWSFQEIYMLPVSLRNWFFDKWREVNIKKPKET